MKTNQFNLGRAHCVAFSLVFALGSAMLPVGGCQLFGERLTADPHSPYPEDAIVGPVLDIQVFRDVTMLKFTNTTTMDFGPSVIWLNKRYSLVIPGFGSGDSVEVDLRSFVDEFGDTYRAGGFYSQREPAPVVLVQIEHANQSINEGQPTLYGLVIVENKYN